MQKGQKEIVNDAYCLKVLASSAFKSKDELKDYLDDVAKEKDVDFKKFTDKI
jgi:hypothetical protein